MTQRSDYDFALQEIRRNMHDPRGSKTTVMVGAGFSRNAISQRGTGKSQFPDWSTLTHILVERLYTNKDERIKILSSAGATSSALRLAQEFETKQRNHLNQPSSDLVQVFMTGHRDRSATSSFSRSRHSWLLPVSCRRSDSASVVKWIH